MDTLLIIVTALSLVMAVVMGATLARVLREERRRSDARVALLAELAAVPSFEDLDLRTRTDEPVPRHTDIFLEHSGPSPWPRRAAVIAAITAVVTVVFVGWRAPAPAAEAGGARMGPATARVQPLELLSLRHAQANGTLTVTGLVQNPRSGLTLERVESTVLVFDRAGALLASGRAPLDFLKVAPGDESPFVIRVPVSGTIDRYRIGFRAADGTVLSHVDRRTTDSVARQEAP